MERKWTTYDEDFWETCPGEIIDMNGEAAEAATDMPVYAEADKSGPEHNRER